MAYEEAMKCITVPANADLSASQYCFVTINSSGNVALTGDGAKIDGVLQNAPSAAGQAATVAISGVTKVKIGAAVTRGGDVSSGANGLANDRTTGDMIGGRALESGTTSGQLVSLLLRQEIENL